MADEPAAEKKIDVPKMVREPAAKVGAYIERVRKSLGKHADPLKAEIRWMALKQRRDHLPAERREKSMRIALRLSEDRNYRSAGSVLCYYAKDDEVDTRPMIVQALLDRKKVYLPKVDWKTKSISAHEVALSDLPRLEAGAFGVQEPPSDIPAAPLEHIELALVPGVAFDGRGNRIGHGMGYYDTLLARMHDAYSIGLAFEFQITDRPIVAEEHDVAVDEIITEARAIQCRKKAAAPQKASRT